MEGLLSTRPTHLVFFLQFRGGIAQKRHSSLNKTYTLYSAPISYLREGTDQKGHSTCLHIFYSSFFLYILEEALTKNGVVAWTRQTFSTLHPFNNLEEEQAKKGVVLVYMFFTLHFKKKLDGVGPVDNRPSNDKLQHFVPPPRKNCDMWHVTRDTWQVTHDT